MTGVELNRSQIRVGKLWIVWRDLWAQMSGRRGWCFVIGWGQRTFLEVPGDD